VITGVLAASTLDCHGDVPAVQPHRARTDLVHAHLTTAPVSITARVPYRTDQTTPHAMQWLAQARIELESMGSLTRDLHIYMICVDPTQLFGDSCLLLNARMCSERAGHCRFVHSMRFGVKRNSAIRRQFSANGRGLLLSRCWPLSTSLRDVGRDFADHCYDLGCSKLNMLATAPG
jgi:hypothetical protein